MGSISAVTCATTVNLVGTYVSSGISDTTFTVTATGVLVIDGHTTVLNDYVLFKDQTSALENGLYQVTTAGDVGIQPVFTRFSGYWNPHTINAFGLINITEGTLNASTTWQLTSNITFLGLDSLNYALSYKKYGSDGSKYIYVDANGSNTTGTGTIVAPYATVSYAESVILDATVNDPVTIMINGTIVDTDIVKKPYINWYGSATFSSEIQFDTFTAHATMDDAESFFTFANVFLSGLTLEIDISAGTHDCTITFENCTVNANIEFTGPTDSHSIFFNLSNNCVMLGNIDGIDTSLNSITTTFSGTVSMVASHANCVWESLSDNITDFSIDGSGAFTATAFMPNSLVDILVAGTVNGANATLQYGPYVNPADLVLSAGGTATPISLTVNDLTLVGDIIGSGVAQEITVTGSFNLVRSSAGSATYVSVNNTSNTASSTALMALTVAGTSAGDPYTQYGITGTQFFCIGIDNSDSDAFKISNFSTLGTNDVLSVNASTSALTLLQATSVSGVLTTTSGRVLKVSPVTSTPYSALTTDNVLACNFAGALAVNLFGSPATGSFLRIKDISGAAAVNNITITPAAGNIDGAGTYVINTNYGSIDLVYTGAAWSIL